MTLSPRIGIFWEVEGALVSETTPTEAVPAVNGIRDSDSAHYTYWPKWVASQHNPMLPDAYDHFPRGRVLLREADRTYLIYADRCLLANTDFLPKLRKTFGLTSKGLRIEVHADEHYQCHACNPHYLSD